MLFAKVNTDRHKGPIHVASINKVIEIKDTDVTEFADALKNDENFQALLTMNYVTTSTAAVKETKFEVVEKEAPDAVPEYAQEEEEAPSEVFDVDKVIEQTEEKTGVVKKSVKRKKL